MSKTILSDDTIIEIGKSITLREFRDFFERATGKQEMQGGEFQPWLVTQAGKTLKEALADFGDAAERKCMSERLKERRFNVISDANKEFMIAFDKEIQKLGYDYGGGIGEGYVWAKFMVVYSKTGVKNKKVIARIYISEDRIVLRLFFGNVDKHRAYIENAPAHIKDVFTNNHGNCSCHPKKENCRSRKIYTIDDKRFEKCSGVVFEFWEPTMDKLSDYINLLAEFYPVKVKVI